jgi:ureidoglycolate lyase
VTGRRLEPRPLTREGFSAFGEVIEVSGAPDRIINQGMCGRHHDLAKLDFTDGRAGISLFDAKARAFPYTVDMVERHPDGSQAFIPLDGARMLVIVASDRGGRPEGLAAFLSGPGQSVNLHRGTWHGVLAPIGAPGRFIVVDRIGAGANLEEHWFDQPYVVAPPEL